MGRTVQGEDYSDAHSACGDVLFLKGLRDVFAAVRPRATFVWHGWNNRDCYCFWAATKSARAMLDKVQAC